MGLPKNRVHQGDCVKLLAELDPGSIDLVFADPPFNIGYEYDVYDDQKNADEYLGWCQQWISGVYRALKSNGTFWLAIGDEYAAELKIEAQKAGFYCRSWVIWYYTFGVNCVNGFSRSHTHVFHFVKDKSKFTFNRVNPQIRVKSARQLVYADARANPNGRLPDNTWITRPQDAPLSFSPAHDTWYFARVAGTFKEREGFHGCQMPEQLLARIIRASSHPQDLVLDPFGGSGTTMCVAKKLGRQWMGFELSNEYAKYIEERLNRCNVGDPLDGSEDPIESAPSTAQGKKRKNTFDEETEKAVIDAYVETSLGYPADYLLCDKELNKSFIAACLKRGLGGNAYVWNRYLLQLRKSSKLPQSQQRPNPVAASEMDRIAFASEVAWRLLAIDYRKTLDELFCSPEFAAEFDRLAKLYGPVDTAVSSLDFRRVAVSIRKRCNAARTSASQDFGKWISKENKLPKLTIDHALQKLSMAGAYVLFTEGAAIYVGESENIQSQLQQLMSNDRWKALNPDKVGYVEENSGLVARYALKSALAQREKPILNCRLLVEESELSDAR